MHTPLPWEVEVSIAAPEIIGDGRRVAMVLYHGGSEDRQVHDNAKFIVKACNMYYRMEFALRSAEAIISGQTNPNAPSIIENVTLIEHINMVIYDMTER